MSTSDGAGPVRPGRRPGASGTRDAIHAAARRRFAENGFDNTSIRSVAAAAGVDPALVHHYFGTEQQLFAAVVALPIDPEIVLRQPIADPPLEKLVAAVGPTVQHYLTGNIGQGAPEAGAP